MSEKLQLEPHPVMTADKTRWRPSVIVKVDGAVQRRVVGEQRVLKKAEAVQLSISMAETMIVQMQNEIIAAVLKHANQPNSK